MARQSGDARPLPKRTHERLAACGAVGLGYWADHPAAGHLWAVDDDQQAHVVRVRRDAGTAQHVCRPELLVDAGCTGDGEAVPYAAPDTNPTQGEQQQMTTQKEPPPQEEAVQDPQASPHQKESPMTNVSDDRLDEEPDDNEPTDDEPIIDGYTCFDGLEEDDDDDYSSLDGEPVITRIRVVTGKVSQYSRVRSGPEFSRTAYVIEPEGKDGKEMHLVTGAMQRAKELQEHLRKVRLHLMVDRFGNPSILVVRAPTGNEMADRWSKSRRDMVRRMKKDWVKFTGNRLVSEYQPVVARVEIGDQKWPNMSMDEVIALAFKAENRIVDRISHPAVGLL